MVLLGYIPLTTKQVHWLEFVTKSTVQLQGLFVSHVRVDVKVACRGIGTWVVTVSQARDADSLCWKCRTRESHSIQEAENKKEFDISERNYVLWNLQLRW